jgi:Leucine-rich repeat (LRR) protein
MLAQLVKLQDLQLSYNELELLPREIGFNTSLTKLKLSYNRLVSVPAELAALSALRDLQLTHNHLTGLPAALGALAPPDGRLSELALAANMFKAPFSHIMQRGTGATLRYLREQM